MASLAVATHPVMAAEENTDGAFENSWSAASKGTVTRVSKDHLEQITTAKSLFACSIYTATGEKIGEIIDIGLGEKLRSMELNQATSRTDDESSTIDENEPGNIRAAEEYQNPSPYVFVSVGGLMGLGNDIIRVPLSSLSPSETEKDHLILEGYSKDRVTAIAEQEPVAFSVNDYRYNPYHFYGNTRAKRVWTDSFDTTAVREALIAEDGLGADDADRIIVGRDGENVILTGSVDTQLQKKKAGEIAQENTGMPVKNDIEVR